MGVLKYKDPVTEEWVVVGIPSDERVAELQTEVDALKETSLTQEDVQALIDASVGTALEGSY